MFVGFLCTLFFFFSSASIGTVANLDKLNTRQNGVMIGLGIAIIGAIFWVGNSLQNKK